MVCGCDTTSAHFRQVKTKRVKVLDTNVLQQVVNIFYYENVCDDDTVEAGHTFLIALYGGKVNEEIFDSLRFRIFQKSLIKK